VELLQATSIKSKPIAENNKTLFNLAKDFSSSKHPIGFFYASKYIIEFMLVKLKYLVHLISMISSLCLCYNILENTRLVAINKIYNIKLKAKKFLRVHAN